MKNYYVKCIMKFTDIEENTLREVNDEFWCTKERYEYLKDNNAVILIENKVTEVGSTKVLNVIPDKPKKGRSKKADK